MSAGEYGPRDGNPTGVFGVPFGRGAVFVLKFGFILILLKTEETALRCAASLSASVSYGMPKFRGSIATWPQPAADALAHPGLEPG